MNTEKLFKILRAAISQLDYSARSHDDTLRTLHEAEINSANSGIHHVEGVDLFLSATVLHE